MDMDENVSSLEALRQCENYLKDHLCYDDIADALYEKHVLTRQEKEDLDKCRERLGDTSMAQELLAVVLKKEEQVLKFLEILRATQVYLAEYVNDAKEKILSGEIAIMKEIQDELRKAYKEQQSNMIEKLPGETFLLDINDENLIMPLDVSAEMLDFEFLKGQRGKVKEQNLKYKYKDVEVLNIEDVFPKLHMEDGWGPRCLIVCKGIAGTGKTVTCHRLTWQWCKGTNANLKGFNMVFFIPLHKVKLSQSLLEIITQLAYVSRDNIRSLHLYLSSVKASSCLWVIDGIDEVELQEGTDIFKLITGQIYKATCVIITSRPDASFFTSTTLTPWVRLKIVGTSKEGIYKHIEASLVRGGPTQKDVTDIIKKCERLMFDFDLLRTPLYLTLITVLFDQYWIQYASFKDFDVPKTRTDLFGRFVNVIIKVWLERSGRKEEVQSCSFVKFPLEKGTGVPRDICRTLLQLGELSLKGLLLEQYSFTDTEFDECFIDLVDIKNSGLLCFNTKDSNFFFRHRTLQEYFAAVYLSKTECTNPIFQNLIRERASKSELTIRELFRPLQLSMQFVAGMSPESISQLILANKERLRIRRGSVSFLSPSTVNIVYETALYLESNDKPLQSAIEEFISKCQTVDYRHSITVSELIYHSPLVHRMISRFAKTNLVQILNKIYKIIVETDEKGGMQFLCDSLGKPMLNSVTFSNLDIDCMILLSQFRFTTINTLHCVNTAFDMTLIESILPCLESVQVEGYQYPHIPLAMDGDGDVSRESQAHATHQIQYIKLKNTQMHTQVLPESATVTICKQSKLQSLHLTRINMFQHLPSLHQQLPQWGSLRELHVVMVQVCINIQKIHALIIHTRELQSLYLQELGSSQYDRAHLISLMDLINSGLSKLHSLSMVCGLDKSSLAVYCEHLSQVHQVTSVGLDQRDITQDPGCVVNTLAASPNVKQLTIYHYEELEDNLQAEMESLKKKRNVKVSYVKYEQWTGDIISN